MLFRRRNVSLWMSAEQEQEQEQEQDMDLEAQIKHCWHFCWAVEERKGFQRIILSPLRNAPIDLLPIDCTLKNKFSSSKSSVLPIT